MNNRRWNDNYESGRSGSENELKEALNTDVNKWIPRAVLGFITGLAMLSSVYTVSPSEEGVVTRFGKHVRTTSSGLHFKAPFIERVRTPLVTEVNRLEVGFRTIKQGPPAVYEKITEESLMLTGDESIVQSEFIVQYRISNSSKYLFNIKGIEETLLAASQAAHRQIVGNNGIDKVLTDGKTEIQIQTKDKLQEIVDSYDMGVQIVAIQLQDVYAPDQVKPAFEDVVSAREEMTRSINQAQGYNRSAIPEARGNAAKLIEDARGYNIERVNTAKGDAERFLTVLTEYKRAPRITEDRLYIETMNKILPNMDKIIVESSDTYNLLDLNKTLGGGN